ncbi:hypothetical protein D8Y22_19140 [Salinadaptatus halalkaliphilus]|uniref:MBL fold metallo-hydrolase n=1 Tax=Salinadaptatus halalkaliphilus TaxID=2419781 RepID=A0A4S3TIC1_9EURY|nr:hypothetical protein [Salinadaptatus halalkaliphilus]THE63280.1 hypothetical protein D8Y22_19140 [Salinadaptatus halalkaliphilus]
MDFRVDERASDFQEIDRYDRGVGWIAHPDERMQRASHALEVDGEVWVVDPVDADGLDELLAEFGEVAGVAVLLDRHKRDAATIANRHDVPVYLPEHFEGVTKELGAPVVRFQDELAETGIEAYPIVTNRFWQEVALFDREAGTLLVPESVGTVGYFCAGSERLGVHPMRRFVPPRRQLGRAGPERILVGHGAGITEDATAVLEEALRTARRRAPRLYAETAWALGPF